MNKIVFAAAFAATALVASAAQAAPQIIGERYQETASATCNNSTSCQVVFASVAATKGLLITRAECRATVPSSVEVFQVTLLSFSANATAGRAIIPVVQGRSISSATDRTYYGGTDANAMFVGATPTINMYGSVATKFTANCTISGVIKAVGQW